MQLEEGSFSESKSMISTFSSVSRLGKNGFNQNKSTASSYEDSTDMKKIKTKTNRVVGNFRNLKYLKLLKYEDKKELLERVKSKESIFESKSQEVFRNLLEQFSKKT